MNKYEKGGFLKILSISTIYKPGIDLMNEPEFYQITSIHYSLECYYTYTFLNKNLVTSY